ncbi:MAG: hypothetical protein GYA57_17905 [Myxococcales bacterium]|nr:hypothetical protein [Myxococcales bacterium]
MRTAAPPLAGRRRTRRPACAGLVLLPVLACGKNTAPLEELDPSTFAAPSGMPGDLPDDRSPGAPPGTGPSQAPAAATWTVSGTVALAPELASRVPRNAVLFVFARVPGARVPEAAQRIPDPRFPVEFTLAAGHAGAPGELPPERLEVVARVSVAGTAGPSRAGDLEGRSREPVAPGASGVLVTIDSVAGPESDPDGASR